MLNINLFGGPGVGKTTTAAKIFTRMKDSGVKVEYIQEFAKDLTYGNDAVRLSDQLHILGEQHHRIHRLKGQVDFIAHDSPFVMGISYLQEDKHLPKDLLEELMVTMFNSYDNLNILLLRNVEKYGYQEYGRNQTLEEAIVKDEEIRCMLVDNDIPFFTVQAGDESIEKILEYVRNHL